jgi:hypothetical protein
MTAEQARVVLKGRSIKDRLEPASRAGNADLPEMFFIDVDGVTVGPHKGAAHLLFDKDRKLVQVSLLFERNEPEGRACRFQGITAQEAATRSSMVVDISEKMIERFGKPTTETGTFPTIEELNAFFAHGIVTGFAQIGRGRRVWITEGQAIEESFLLPCGDLLLSIIYKPQTKDEL